jgi:hypothetical protein
MTDARQTDMGFTPPAPPPVELYPTPVRSAYGRARHVLLCQAPSTRRRQCRRYAVGVVAGEPRCRVHKEVPVSRKKAASNGPVVTTQASHHVAGIGTLQNVGGKFTLIASSLDPEGGATLVRDATESEVRSYVDGLVALIGVGLPKPKRVRARKAKETAAAAA